MPNYEEEWTESGLIDDFAGTVVDGRFATDARVRDGNVLCYFLNLQTDDPEHPMHEHRVTMGEGWSSPDGGRTAVHVDDRADKQKKINNNSGMGRLIIRLVELGMGPVIANAGGPRNAASLVGQSFHWKRDAIDYGGEIGKQTILLPDKVLVAGQAAQAPVAQAPVPAAVPQAPAPVAPVAPAPAAPAWNPAPAGAAPTMPQQVASAPVPAAPPVPPGIVPAPAAAGIPPGLAAMQAPVAPAPVAAPAAVAGEFDAVFATVDPQLGQQITAYAKAQDYSTWMDTVMDLPGVIQNATLMGAISNESFYTLLRG